MISQMKEQFGHYRLIRRVGRGGFADVYLAENTELQNTRVALKLLRPKIDIETLRQEARILEGLRGHPSIVHLRDFGIEEVEEDDDFGATKYISFLAMDYASGGTIHGYYAAKLPLPPDDAKVYLKEIADGLQYAHKHDVIHCDIKPQNILIGTDAKLLLSDFGIAVIVESLPTQMGQNILGTISYMAPEQIQGKPCRASDQYALGVVVYEWLCGRRPFVGNYNKVMWGHLFTPPPPLRQMNPKISPAIEVVVMKTLAKNPKDRYPEVQEFADTFEAACKPDARPSRIDMLSGKYGRRKLFTGAALVAGLTFTGVGFIVDKLAHLPRANFTYNEHTDMVIAVAWSPDGKSIASGGHDRAIRIWDANSGTDLVTYNEPPSIALYSVEWSPNGKEIASGSEYGEARVWDVSTQYVVSINKVHTTSVNTLAWSPDGKLIASGSRDKTVQVWNAITGQSVLTYHGHHDSLKSVVWSPDGKLIASGSRDKTVQIWDSTTGQNVLTYHGHTADVWAVSWSPDGKLIASGGDDGTVQVWNAATGNTDFTYLGHTNFQLRAAEWSPDGMSIASGGTDSLVQVWKFNSKSPFYIYRGHSQRVEGLTWSPDGTRIASASDDKTVQVWQIPQSK